MDSKTFIPILHSLVVDPLLVPKNRHFPLFLSLLYSIFDILSIALVKKPLLLLAVIQVLRFLVKSISCHYSRFVHFYGRSLNFTLSALPFERRLVGELVHNGSFSRELPEETYSRQKGARGSAL